MFSRCCHSSTNWRLRWSRRASPPTFRWIRSRWNRHFLKARFPLSPFPRLFRSRSGSCSPSTCCRFPCLPVQRHPRPISFTSVIVSLAGDYQRITNLIFSFMLHLGVILMGQQGRDQGTGRWFLFVKGRHPGDESRRRRTR